MYLCRKTCCWFAADFRLVKNLSYNLLYNESTTTRIKCSLSLSVGGSNRFFYKLPTRTADRRYCSCHGIRAGQTESHRTRCDRWCWLVGDDLLQLSTFIVHNTTVRRSAELFNSDTGGLAVKVSCRERDWQKQELCRQAGTRRAAAADSPRVTSTQPDATHFFLNVYPSPLPARNPVAVSLTCYVRFPNYSWMPASLNALLYTKSFTN